MTTGSFIVKNAFRNKRRAALSILSVAVSLFLLVTLLVGLREFTVPIEDVGAALRVVVRSKVSIANFLPARQRSTIERVPGVEAVSPFSWFGGKFRNEESMTFAQFAMEADKLTRIFGEAKVPPDQLEAFIKNQRGCIVGKITADKYKLKIGDWIPFTSVIYPCTLEMQVMGIYEGTPDDRNVLFHHKYLDESCGSPGWVGTWWLKVRSAEDMPSVLDSINKAFANTSAEVRAESERAFQLSFISMLGDITLLVNSICSVVIFTLVLVTASTMSMAIRERFRELAVLKALGYRRRDLFAFILAESFGLAALGALIGVGGAWALYTFTPIMSAVTKGIIIRFEVTPRIIGVAATVAAGLGIIASIAPSIAVARTSVVNGLKTLD
ncbi:MAG: ABC transporter permease [Verrucomicrobia subdivision 3 bacterium]|nr:ABC transporter permease [Limisphaerales bacterium]